MRKITFGLVWIALAMAACNRSPKKNTIPETRTSGTTTLLVDESFSRILDDQVAVFKSDYPNTKVTTILGNEHKILPKFLNGEVKMIVLSRMLKPEEEAHYKKIKYPIYTDRFAIDGIALITNSNNIDTNITVSEVLALLKGTAKTDRKLVFDNPNSSTIRFFMDSAKVKKLPKTGVYTLQNNNDVVKYVATHQDYIGVVGVNWLLENNKDILSYLPQIKLMGVKNMAGKKGETITTSPHKTTSLVVYTRF